MGQKPGTLPAPVGVQGSPSPVELGRGAHRVLILPYVSLPHACLSEAPCKALGGPQVRGAPSGLRGLVGCTGSRAPAVLVAKAWAPAPQLRSPGGTPWLAAGQLSDLGPPPCSIDGQRAPERGASPSPGDLPVIKAAVTSPPWGPSGGESLRWKQNVSLFMLLIWILEPAQRGDTLHISKMPEKNGCFSVTPARPLCPLRDPGTPCPSHVRAHASPGAGTGLAACGSGSGWDWGHPSSTRPSVQEQRNGAPGWARGPGFLPPALKVAAAPRKHGAHWGCRRLQPWWGGPLPGL